MNPIRPNEKSLCSDCGDSGWVIVPHPDYVVLGEWMEARFNRLGLPVRLTAAVTCHCSIGSNVLEANTKRAGLKGTKPMTFGIYRARVHDRPAELERRTREDDRLAESSKR